MVVADLHVHTHNSDGTMTLEQIPAAAQEAGLECVAITDHDRFHPALEEPITTLEGITVVSGIELRVETDTERLDLLGYGVSPTDSLEGIIADLQADRKERARSITECVESELGVDLAVEFGEGVGRPHIARAIEASNTAYDYHDAFADLIGNDCECYLARDIPSFETGLACLREACSVVGLAHPLRYDDVDTALSHAKRLDAIELHYPYGHTVDTTAVERVAADNDLVITGGSDAHGETLGRAGLGRVECDRFQDALTA